MQAYGRFGKPISAYVKAWQNGHGSSDSGGLMPTKTVIAHRSALVATLALTTFLVVQVAVALAAGPETYALPPVVGQQLATPTPFRFVAPAPGTIPNTTTTTTNATAPRAGGFPLELA